MVDNGRPGSAVENIREDVPRTGEATPLVFEHFRKRGTTRVSCRRASFSR